MLSIPPTSLFERWRKPEQAHLYAVVEDASEDGFQESKSTLDRDGHPRRNKLLYWTFVAVLWLISAAILGVIVPLSPKLFERQLVPQWFPDGEAPYKYFRTRY